MTPNLSKKRVTVSIICLLGLFGLFDLYNSLMSGLSGSHFLTPTASAENSLLAESTAIEPGGAKANESYAIQVSRKEVLPISFGIEPVKRIYSSREGLMVKLVLKANRRAKVCLAKDILTQVNFKVSKSGQMIPLKPLVVKDNSELFAQPVVVKWLEPGQELNFRTNLKRLGFANGDRWEPGEYNVKATYTLCEQSEDKPYDPAAPELSVPAKKVAWLMIMS